MWAGRMKVIDYEGMVYCASVPPNALLFTRRKGYTLWSGNCGVPKSIFDAVDALATNSNARVVAVGNPMIRRRTSRRSASRLGLAS